MLMCRVGKNVLASPESASILGITCGEARSYTRSECVTERAVFGLVNGEEESCLEVGDSSSGIKVMWNRQGRHDDNVKRYNIIYMDGCESFSSIGTNL